MKCACPCGKEFEPKRRNRIYLNAEHGQKDNNRRWPPKRQAFLPVLSRNGLGKRQQAQTSGLTPLLGSEMAQTLKRALQAQKRRKIAPGSDWGGMLTPSEVGAILRVSRWTLMEWRKSGKGPPFFKFNHATVRYPALALMRFLKEHLSGSAVGVIPLFGGTSTDGEEIGDVSASAETAS
jgi:hypothetical protein